MDYRVRAGMNPAPTVAPLRGTEYRFLQSVSDLLHIPHQYYGRITRVLQRSTAVISE